MVKKDLFRAKEDYLPYHCWYRPIQYHLLDRWGTIFYSHILTEQRIYIWQYLMCVIVNNFVLWGHDPIRSFWTWLDEYVQASLLDTHWREDRYQDLVFISMVFMYMFLKIFVRLDIFQPVVDPFLCNCSCVFALSVSMWMSFVIHIYIYIYVL